MTDLVEVKSRYVDHEGNVLDDDAIGLCRKAGDPLCILDRDKVSPLRGLRWSVTHVASGASVPGTITSDKDLALEMLDALLKVKGWEKLSVEGTRTIGATREFKRAVFAALDKVHDAQAA